VSGLKGYLVVDDVSLEEAKELMKHLYKKKGRWLSKEAMGKIDGAAQFAMLTHRFAKVQPEEVYEFKTEGE